MTGNEMELTTLLSVIALGVSLLIAAVNAALLVLVWRDMEGHRKQSADHAARLLVLESSIKGIDDIRERQQTQSEQLSALMERTASSQEMLLSIQDFLRERSP